MENGIYRHYKGEKYKVLAVAKHSETLEDMVVYQAIYGSGEIWVRPLSMFCQTVESGGQLVPRFAKLDESEGQE